MTIVLWVAHYSHERSELTLHLTPTFISVTSPKQLKESNIYKTRERIKQKLLLDSKKKVSLQKVETKRL